MKKYTIGVFLGALVLFVWGAVSWMLLPWHDWTIKKLPEEQLISDTLKTVVKEPGVYCFPSDKGPDGRMGQVEWAEKHRKGPLGFLVFSPHGHEPMGSGTFLIGFLGNFLIASFVMVLFSLCRERVRGFWNRSVLAAGVGSVVWLAAHVPYWNWFSFPCGYTLVLLFDAVIGFALMGLVMSKFVSE